METDKGRILMSGADVPETRDRLWFHQFSSKYGPSDGMTPILFNMAPRSASFWASWNRPPDELFDCLELFDWPGRMSWHHTHAALKDIVEITPCLLRAGRNRVQLPKPWPKQGQIPVLGLLLRYVDGRRASVGEFRHDWASEPLIVGTAQRLYLGFLAEHMTQYSRVAEVRLSPPPETDSDCDWMEIPWTGRLVWEFTPNECDVTHEQVETDG